VHVLCEKNLCNEPLPLYIHELGKVHPKPRWLAHIRFSKHVHQWLEANRTSDMVIHSHERTQDHHITTFHGPPFAKVRDFPIWKRLSLRVYMNLWLEKRELCTPQVQQIVPNSAHINQALAHYYPEIAKKLSKPVPPGVAKLPKRPNRAIPDDGGVIGFIGKEWKRKGLQKAISIVEHLAKTRPNVQFLVAGPSPSDIQGLFAGVNFDYSLLGTVEPSAFYPQLDTLLHPAIAEPYGMVITESLTTDVPVIISDVCGAANDVSSDDGSTLSLTSNPETWADQLEHWLQREANNHSHYQRSWQTVAIEYEQLYRKLNIT